MGPALDICYGDNGYIPYIVYAWKGHTTIQSYYLDARRPIPGDLLLSWFVHAMQVVAPCVANHGLVVYDAYARHALIDPTGVLIPATEFVQIDPDGFAPSWLWVSNSAHTQVNNTAAFLNRILLGRMLFQDDILRYGVFEPSDVAAVKYVCMQIDTLRVFNDNLMLSIDHPDIFFAKNKIFHQWNIQLDVWRNAYNNFHLRALVPVDEYAGVKRLLQYFKRSYR